jgi:phage terminase small subunit
MANAETTDPIPTTLPSCYKEAFGLDPVQKLKPSWREFVKYYLITNNATKAGELAGFQAIGYGRQLLMKKPIIAALVAIKNHDLTSFDVTVESIVERLTIANARAIALSDLQAEIRSLELLGKYAGVFEKDNQQKQGNVLVQMNFNADKPSASKDTAAIEHK